MLVSQALLFLIKKNNYIFDSDLVWRMQLMIIKD